MVYNSGIASAVVLVELGCNVQCTWELASPRRNNSFTFSGPRVNYKTSSAQRLINEKTSFKSSIIDMSKMGIL